MSNISGMAWQEVLYASTASGATVTGSTTTEQAMCTTGTMGVVPMLAAGLFPQNAAQVGRGFRITARGSLATAGTIPSLQLTIRASATTAQTTGLVVLGMPAGLALPLTSGTQLWEAVGDVFVTTVGAQGANSTLRGVGHALMPNTAAGAAVYSGLWAGASAATPTVTTFDLTQPWYVNVNAVWTAGGTSASNTITLQQVIVEGLN